MQHPDQIDAAAEQTLASWAARGLEQELRHVTDAELDEHRADILMEDRKRVYVVRHPADCKCRDLRSRPAVITTSQKKTRRSAAAKKTSKTTASRSRRKS